MLAGVRMPCVLENRVCCVCPHDALHIYNLIWYHVDMIKSSKTQSCYLLTFYRLICPELQHYFFLFPP